MPKVALFDMDGTLFDYDRQMKRDLIKLASPHEAEITAQITNGDQWQLANEHPFLEARMDLIKSVPGWWKNLPIYQLGWNVLAWAKDIGFCTKILTKGPRSKSRAWAEKVDCITMHFGEDMPIDIVGRNKSDVYGRVLVDDYPPYMEGWLANRPRGLGIVPAGKVNEGFTHPNVIRYDGTNGEEVQVSLQAAYDRESKQSWQELAPWRKSY